MEHATLIGIAGLLLVFTSFTVKNWLWLYSFNLTGALLLTLYAYLIRDPIFTIVEAGISGFLAYRLLSELKRRKTLAPVGKSINAPTRNT
ncbi:MAG: hypothetical protein LRS43_00755 [Desulfurococcales archaeon]|nr:hypothetical protein [Desulfurococcales archaeon]